MRRNGRTLSRPSSVVAGVDVGTRRAAYCILHARGQDLHLDNLSSFAVRGDTMPDKLASLWTQLDAALRVYRPTLIAVEDGYVGRNPRTSLVIGMARGVALLVAQKYGKAVLVDPSEARKACGVTRFDQCRGAAKAQVLVMVCRILKLATAPDEDAADAAAVAVWAAGRLWQFQGTGS